MLDGLVAEVELGPGQPHVGLVERGDELLEPALGDRLDVVVEEDQPVAGGVADADVDLLAEVEGAVEGHQHEPLPRDRPELVEHGGRRRGVVHDHDLHPLVVGALQQRADRLDHQHRAPPAHQGGLAGGRDDDGDGALGRQATAYDVAARLRARAGLGVDADPVEVLLHGADPGGLGVRLGLDVDRGRALDGAPVVEHLRDVDDPARALGDAQHEVVVLGALEALTEAADLADQAGAQHGEVGGVHLAAQALG